MPARSQREQRGRFSSHLTFRVRQVVQPGVSVQLLGAGTGRGASLPIFDLGPCRPKRGTILSCRVGAVDAMHDGLDYSEGCRGGKTAERLNGGSLPPAYLLGSCWFWGLSIGLIRVTGCGRCGHCGHSAGLISGRNLFLRRHRHRHRSRRVMGLRILFTPYKVLYHSILPRLVPQSYLTTSFFHTLS
jgi:hypothetical protein